MFKTGKNLNPLLWIGSLYFAQGLPYVVVMTLSVIMYKRLGLSNAEIAFYTSWLYLPWVIKPLWSPLIELFSTKRIWILLMQLIMGASFASIALSLHANNFFKWSLIIFWLLAFNSATHDIAADGFYILALDSHKQALFVGFRSTFYRLSMIVGQGLMVMLVGYFESSFEGGEFELKVNAIKPEILKKEKCEISTLFLFPPSSNSVGNSNKINFKFFPSASIAIPNSKISKEEFSKILYEVKKINSSDKRDSDLKTVKIKKYEENNIKKSIESFIKKFFAEDKRKLYKNSDFTGNIGVILVSLDSKLEADKKIVVNFDFKKGDKSIKLIEGERHEFTSENCSKPHALLFQLDPNLNGESSATFFLRFGNVKLAWSIIFVLLSLLFFIFFIYHLFLLPKPVNDISSLTSFFKTFSGFFSPFLSFFKKDNILPAISFLLLYRLGEAQLVKLSSPFLLDAKTNGGLSLSTGALGFVYGTMGVFLLTIGGIIGGIMVARHGLKKWMFPMAIAINLPNIVYVYLAYYQPEKLSIITALVGIEQFGYGFGFAAYMLFMVYYAGNSDFKTTHYAIMTGFMALGMMLPGMWSGWLQELIGYKNFFIWVCISTIPGFLIIPFLKIDPQFGIKMEKK